MEVFTEYDNRSGALADVTFNLKVLHIDFAQSTYDVLKAGCLLVCHCTRMLQIHICICNLSVIHICLCWWSV